MSNRSSTGRLRRVAQAAAGAAVCAGLLAATYGCSRAKTPPAQPAAPAQTNQAAKRIVIPGLKEAGIEEVQSGSSAVIVATSYDRPEKESYRCDPLYPSGTIKGRCRFVTKDNKKKLPFPPETLLEFTGPNAILKPEPGEIEFYKNLELKRNNFVLRLGYEGSSLEYIPAGVVVMLRHVEVGRRTPLSRPTLAIKNGRIARGDASNFGAENIQFGPLHEPCTFTTWDSFPSEVVVTRRETGEIVSDQMVRYLQTDDNKTFGDKGIRFLAYKPEFVATPALRDPGVYEVADKRHPWIQCYLLVVDNPYAAVNEAYNNYHRYNGSFEISAVPPGTHTMEVWHPLYQPFKKSFQVTVEADKTTEVMVDFLPPEEPAAGH